MIDLMNRHMESQESKVGRGRGRGRRPFQFPVAPSISAAASNSAPSHINESATAQCLTENRTISLNLPSLNSDNVKPRVQFHKLHGLGTLGKQVQLRVNYFQVLQFPQKGCVYRYYIEIRNKRHIEISREHRRVVYKCWLKQFCEQYPLMNQYKIVFDNQSAIFTYNQPLPAVNESSVTVKIMGPNRANHQEEYEFCIKRVGDPIDLGLLSSLSEPYDTRNNSNIHAVDIQYIKQLLSIALHEHCSSQAKFIYNRSFFSHPGLNNKYQEWDLGSGKVLWRGFYSSLVFADGDYPLFMNLDVSHAIFMKKQPFLDFLCELMLHSPCGKWRYGRNRKISRVSIQDVVEFLDQSINGDYYNGEIDFLLKHCKHIRVRMKTANVARHYDINDLGKSSLEQTFAWKAKNYQLTTVSNYWKEQGTTLKYPLLPTLKMTNGMFRPMEVFDVEPVRVKKITDEEQALLCRSSLLSPTAYRHSIEEVRTSSEQQCFEHDPVVTAWNFKIDNNMHIVPARILPMPDVIYNDKHRITDQQCETRGVWRDTKIPFYIPSNFPSVWAIINLSPSAVNRKACETFYIDLRDFARQRGILKCPAPIIYEEYDVQSDSIESMITALENLIVQNSDCEFLVVVLPEDSNIRDKVYGEVKKLCEIENGLGIVTQMIRATTFAENNTRGNNGWNYSTLNYILAKINTKLNGINFILHPHESIENLFSESSRIMYVGIDLSHPPPGSGDRRSIVAVVASADDLPYRYFKEVDWQYRSLSSKESKENIVRLKQIMISLISQYKKHRGYLPGSIIIYRDGISDSEFQNVFPKELNAIQTGCAEISSVHIPCLTYIVVNKRHHTRFFPTNSDGNVEAGTVIDSHDIMNPTTYNFFLSSHHGRLGTSRPTHYHVLHDDNKLTPDQIQMLTYTLCYAYARYPSSVSAPAPAKYANLLAYRAKFYLSEHYPSDTEDLTSQSNAEADEHQTDHIIKMRLSSKLVPDCPFFI